ncbi:tyrosine-type recombinase/integrase [Streptomyces sp. TRM72054]|nr:tyrosine-type recombinase/integrase [Streptomyces sp. TRM72054]
MARTGLPGGSADRGSSLSGAVRRRCSSPSPSPTSIASPEFRAIHIHTKHGLLSAIIQSAVDAETSLRASNPCAKTRLPRLDSTEDEEEIVFLEREEWAWIHECLRDDAKELGETIAETGFRWGRRARSSPRDLRRRNGRPAIRVQRAWKKDEDGKSVLGPPKTRKSRRTVVITHKLDRMLRRRAKGLKQTTFCSKARRAISGTPGTFRRLRWVPAIELAAEKYGLIKRPRIHDLRHSHASWLIAAKVPLPAIQRWAMSRSPPQWTRTGALGNCIRRARSCRPTACASERVSGTAPDGPARTLNRPNSAPLSRKPKDACTSAMRSASLRIRSGTPGPGRVCLAAPATASGTAMVPGPVRPCARAAGRAVPCRAVAAGVRPTGRGVAAPATPPA